MELWPIKAAGVEEWRMSIFTQQQRFPSHKAILEFHGEYHGLTEFPLLCTIRLL